jgi:two-component system nitrogen regulation sensor histidine kinase NtrY
MTSTRVAGRSRRRLQLRLALFLALGSVVLFAATAWFFSSRVVRTLDEGLQVELERRLERVDETLVRAGAEVTQALERLEARWRVQDAAVIRELIEGGAGAAPVAADQLAASGLEVLTVLDAAGVVVSSGHWPERAGLRDPDLRGVTRETFRIQSVGWPQGARLVLLASRPMQMGQHRLELIGGRSLRAVLKERVFGGEMKLFDFADPRPAPGGSEAAFVGSGADGPDRLTTPQALYGRRVLIDAQGHHAGSVVVVVDRSETAALVGEMRRSLLITGLLVTALGAVGGVWIGGRLDRPVRQLLRAVEAIGAGEADYTFPRATQDEYEELEQAFSRAQRSLRDQRRRSAAAERVAAWREVARHVAHEVKNPLAPIRLTVENLIRARRDDPALFDELFDEGAATILEEVDQLKQLVEEFSAFARLPAPKPRSLDLHELIEGVTDLFGSEPGLELRTEYDRTLPSIDADPDQLSRALKNIVGNAVEAMRERESTEPRVLDLRTRREGEFLVVEVRDTGPGLSPEARDGIFQPYFTTKSHGTGLGMAIAHRIVTEHGGLLGAENRDEGGARVSIRLPLTSMTAAAHSATHEDEASA